MTSLASMVAGLDNHAMEPREKITLRQGARVMMKNWTD